MNIIKRGKPPEEAELKTTCTYCRTIFTFLPREAKSSDWDMRDHVKIFRINCPICNRECFGYQYEVVWKSGGSC